MDEDEKMTSLRWTFADENNDNAVRLPWVGTGRSDCEVIYVPDRAPIQKIRVFRWESQLISGLGIRLLGIEETLKEALYTADYVDFEFETGKELAVG